MRWRESNRTGLLAGEALQSKCDLDRRYGQYAAESLEMAAIGRIDAAIDVSDGKFTQVGHLGNALPVRVHFHR